MNKHKFELGSLAENIITGLQGILTARCEYLNGCVQYCIQPRIDKDGNDVKHDYDDEGSIRILKTPAEVIAQRNSEIAAPTKTGGPQKNMPSA